MRRSPPPRPSELSFVGSHVIVAWLLALKTTEPSLYAHIDMWYPCFHGGGPMHWFIRL